MAMAGGNGRIHTYYAEAHAIGRRTRSQQPTKVLTHGQIFLDADAGGKRTCELAPVRESGISIDSACLEVVGFLDETQGWMTSATSDLRGFNARDVITADRIVATIKAMHPLVGYVPALCFEEVRFDNLQINGQVVIPALNLQIAGETPKEVQGKDPDSDPYLDEYLTSEGFLAAVRAQDAAIANNPNAPVFAQTKYKRKPGRCTVECSVVTEARGVPRDYRAAGHVIEVPKFGNVFLGEFFVGQHFDLTMMRLELEDGMFSIGGPGVNGKTKP
jgi:hypothetical protein